VAPVSRVDALTNSGVDSIRASTHDGESQNPRGCNLLDVVKDSAPAKTNDEGADVILLVIAVSGTRTRCKSEIFHSSP